jgi:hypothetical protein
MEFTVGQASSLPDSHADLGRLEAYPTFLDSSHALASRLPRLQRQT